MLLKSNFSQNHKMSKTVELSICVDPIFFGSDATIQNVDSFAFNLNRNLEKFFNVKSDYTTSYHNNTYNIYCEDPRMELEISSFIENNWHNVPPKK
jgi:hypothetical protein